MAHIDITGVSKTFRAGRITRPVLDGVTLAVERGEFVSIVGSMGCGKSTLLGIAAGLVTPDAGEVTIDGASLRGVLRGASIVFQNYALLPWLSALENVRLAIGAAFPGWPTARQRSHAKQYLDMVGLGNAVHRRPNQLSGGMRQRVAIARAFATEPEILLLDEPFGALDALTRGGLQQELARMCSTADRTVTTIMISNNVEEALLLSDRIVPMTQGPGATLGASVAVELPRPRTLAMLMHDEQASIARAHVIERLTENVRRARRRAPPAAGTPSEATESAAALAYSEK